MAGQDNPFSLVKRVNKSSPIQTHENSFALIRFDSIFFDLITRTLRVLGQHGHASVTSSRWMRHRRSLPRKPADRE
jgi:hypothetical protein